MSGSIRHLPIHSFEPLLKQSSGEASPQRQRVGSVPAVQPPLPKAPSARSRDQVRRTDVSPPDLVPQPLAPSLKRLLEERCQDGVPSSVSGEENAWRWSEGRALFDMLDRDHDGCLTQREARTWLRSLGWCLDDEALDTLLEEAALELELESSCLQATEPPQRKKRQWALPQLFYVAELGQDLCGPDPEALREALRILGVRGPGSSKERFKQLALGHEGGLTEGDVEDMFQLCGIPSNQKTVGLDPLANGIVDSICNPKVSGLQGHARRLLGPL